jgi:hypothetical protein
MVNLLGHGRELVPAHRTNRELWPTRSGAWRTASLLTGQLSQMKGRVVENLVGFATSA